MLVTFFRFCTNKSYLFKRLQATTNKMYIFQVTWYIQNASDMIVYIMNNWILHFLHPSPSPLIWHLLPLDHEHKAVWYDHTLESSVTVLTISLRKSQEKTGLNEKQGMGIECLLFLVKTSLVLLKSVLIFAKNVLIFAKKRPYFC